MKARSRPTLVVQEPLPNKTIWSFQGLNLKLTIQVIGHLSSVSWLCRIRTASSLFNQPKKCPNYFSNLELKNWNFAVRIFEDLLKTQSCSEAGVKKHVCHQYINGFIEKLLISN